MPRKNVDVISNKVRDSAEKVAKASMLTAALDLKSGEEGMTDIGVTVDGTWQKRGFSSLNGVVAVISITNGKVLDVESMSRHCKSCMINAPMKNTDPKRYESWRIQHVTLIISVQRQIWKVLELLVFLNDHWKIMDFVI